ncbi:MAG: Hsp20/alpha crystallin family protein [Bacilli bacterium]|nr:Hsp20/alpha crystallin family protein [Bacilli bacterium]
MRMLPKRYDLDSVFDTLLTPSENMKCDIYEKDGNYYIEADMPGMDKKDVKVSFDNGYLSISAETSSSKEEKEKDFIRQERFSGFMERKFYVGEIDEGAISANFKDGVLKVKVPKETVKKTKKTIEIN